MNGELPQMKTGRSVTFFDDWKGQRKAGTLIRQYGRLVLEGLSETSIRCSKRPDTGCTT